MIGDGLDSWPSIAHCDPCPSPLQHLDVVAAITERDHLIDSNTQVLDEYLKRNCLVITCRGDIDDG